MRGRITTVLALIALAALCAPIRAANPSSDPLLRALQEEMDRSRAKLKMDHVNAPYYIEYRVSEVDSFEASAVFGALRSQQRGKARFLRVVVRIGDYKEDSYFGSGEGTADMIPLDDDVFAIRHRLWLATDRAYKAAGEALSAKQAALKQLKVDQPVDDFSRAAPVELVEPLAKLSASDFSPWLRLIEEASRLYRTDEKIEAFESALRFTAVNHYYVNSEGTVARTGGAHYAISVSGVTQAPDGMRLVRAHGDEGKDLNGLPDREKFLKTAARMLETLKLLRDAPIVDEEYRGPVLFSNDASSSIVAELVEPNVLGKKPQLGENGRTTGPWASSYKARVLPDFIDVFDDPTISFLGSQPLFGAYALDDEGVKAQRVSVVEKGQLVSFLVGRGPIRGFPESNGHGRAGSTTPPTPAPGNLILQSRDPQLDAKLKDRLIALAKQRDLPYAFYVETFGPRLEPRLIYRIYTKDGHEELVRGAVFGDLDVRSLRNNLIAVGSEPAMENRLDSIPYTVASPAMLFDELQIKRTQTTKQELPEYPAPPLRKGN